MKTYLQRQRERIIATRNMSKEACQERIDLYEKTGECLTLDQIKADYKSIEKENTNERNK